MTDVATGPWVLQLVWWQRFPPVLWLPVCFVSSHVPVPPRKHALARGDAEGGHALQGSVAHSIWYHDLICSSCESHLTPCDPQTLLLTSLWTVVFVLLQDAQSLLAFWESMPKSTRCSPSNQIVTSEPANTLMHTHTHTMRCMNILHVHTFQAHGGQNISLDLTHIMRTNPRSQLPQEQVAGTGE